MPDNAELRNGKLRESGARNGSNRTLTDEQLLRHIAAGNEIAFSAFFSRYQRPVYRFALQMSGRPQVADEVVQDTFMTLMHEAVKFDPSRGAPQSFLFGIARNHLRRHAEGEARFVALPEDLHGGSNDDHAGSNGSGRLISASRLAVLKSKADDPLEEISRAEIVTNMRRAILALPEHYREVLTLCDLEGVDYAAAAKVLDCPIGTVRSRLARARDMLLEKLRPTAGVRQSITAGHPSSGNPTESARASRAK